MNRSLCVSIGISAITLLGCLPHPASAQVSAPEAQPCTASLLRRAARFDSTQIGEMPGRYQLVHVDTLKTRPREQRDGPSHRTEIRIWATDSAVLRASAVVPRQWGQPHVGPMSGTVIGFDTTGFSSEHPQLQVTGGAHSHLEILWDPRVGRGMLDGGHVMDLLPIEVRGPWGFGGYYDTLGDLIVIEDRNRKLVPSFAGFYCAIRVR